MCVSPIKNKRILASLPIGQLWKLEIDLIMTKYTVYLRAKHAIKNVFSNKVD
jgi:hypothetical protein